MIDNFGNQVYPGSVDNGKTDTEYTPTGYERTMLYPPKSKGICAADEQHADHEARIAALETQVHRLLNSEPAHPPITPSSGPRTLTEEYLQGYTDGLAAASHVPEAGYAHIPTAEWEALKEELEGLRTFKARVPWEAVKTCLWHMPNGAPFAPFKTLDMWHKDNAPKENTNE